MASADVITTAITAAVTATTRVVSADLAYQLTDLAAAIDDGQEFGLAHSDYSASEVEECLEAQSSMDVGDKIAQEQANRLVRSIGFFGGSELADSSLNFNDGRPVKTKLNWLLSIGDTINLWVRNGSDTVYTTGTGLAILGNIWVKP